MGSPGRAARSADAARADGRNGPPAAAVGTPPAADFRLPPRPLTLAARTLRTPLGTLRVTASDAGVHAVEWPRRAPRRALDGWIDDWLLGNPEPPPLTLALQELHEYFAGTRTVFTAPLAPVGTPFQLAVWSRVARIPFGTTATYGEIAGAAGAARRARAVGAAVGANPLPVLIPCHRVVGARGSLVGYRAGLRRKAWLLRHERVLLA